jgi:hypothetical protein
MNQKNTIIFGLLKAQKNLLEEQKQLMNQIKKAEGTYQDKIGPMANISNSLLYIGLETSFSNLGDKISNIEYNINMRKLFPFGISSLESELKRQKDYFLQLKKEYQIVLNYSLISGGAGYNYTAFLKLLIRLTKIQSNIYEIDKGVKNRMGISKILAK